MQIIILWTPQLALRAPGVKFSDTLKPVSLNRISKPFYSTCSSQTRAPAWIFHALADSNGAIRNQRRDQTPNPRL